jgi:lysophospholipase L1-like esterase
MLLGDSKTQGQDWQPALAYGLQAATGMGQARYDGGVSAIDTATLAGAIAGIMAAFPVESAEASVKRVTYDMGVNDVFNSTLPNEATWKANTLAIWDAVNARYPNATMYVMRPWKRGQGTSFDTMATWLATLVASRGYTLSPAILDERTWLANGDDGVTYTADGIHPNAAGRLVERAVWQNGMGF